MSIYHAFLAFIVTIVWGINFIFIKLVLHEISPLFLCTLRFFLSSFPLVFFIKRPTVPFKMVVEYGLIMFALQFALLFLGLQVGMTSGMASLIMQGQIFFSMFFAAVFLGERSHFWQIMGAVISFLGIALVALHLDASISFLGFVCVLGSAAAWGYGNLITKKMFQVNMMSLVIWGSFVACLPMFLFTLYFEGLESMIYSYHHLTSVGLISLMYIVAIATWVGYGLWNWLISRYPVGKIVPFSLLVPIVGMLSSVLFLDETMQQWKMISALFVLLGLCINLFGQRVYTFFLFKFTSSFQSGQ